MQKEKMIKKLAAVKALAERGEGGEKETAMWMYSELKRKYGITDAYEELTRQFESGCAGC